MRTGSHCILVDVVIPVMPGADSQSVLDSWISDCNNQQAKKFVADSARKVLAETKAYIFEGGRYPDTGLWHDSACVLMSAIAADLRNSGFSVSL